MKIFKRILIVLAVLILIVSAIGLLFFPSKIHVERSIVINRNQEVVFNYLNNLKNWNSWSPWHDLDSAAQYTFSGPESGVGANMSWTSKKKEVGIGSMTFTESTPPSSVKIDLNFQGEGAAKAEFNLEPVENNTKVTWGLNMDAGANPIMRIMGSFMDKMVGADFDKGLNKLKPILESMQSDAGQALKIEKTSIPQTYYMFVSDTAVMATIGMKIGKGLGIVGMSMKKQNLKMAGAPFVIYHEGGPGKIFKMDIAAIVDKPGKDDGEVKAGEMKPGNAVMVRYFGAYDKMKPAYDALQEYIRSNNQKITGSPWESYVSDPGMEKDTAKWETDVYYPVE